MHVLKALTKNISSINYVKYEMWFRSIYCAIMNLHIMRCDTKSCFHLLNSVPLHPHCTDTIKECEQWQCLDREPNFLPKNHSPKFFKDKYSALFFIFWRVVLGHWICKLLQPQKCLRMFRMFLLVTIGHFHLVSHVFLNHTPLHIFRYWTDGDQEVVL